MDGDTFGLASHFFSLLFFPTAVASSSSSYDALDWLATRPRHFRRSRPFSIIRHLLDFLFPNRQPGAGAFLSTNQTTLPRPFYSGAIRDSDQSLMRSLESIYRNLSVVVGRFPQWHWKNSRVAIKFDRFEFLENDTLVDLQCCTGRRFFHPLLIFHFI